MKTPSVAIWMPLYLGDYLAETGRLSTEQHGAYLLLLLDYWRNGPLPDENEVLAQVTRLSLGDWLVHRLALEPLFVVRDGVWRHPRLDEEHAKASTHAERSQERARRAAEARWGPARTAQAAEGNADALLTDCPSPSPSPSTTSTLSKEIANAISLDAPAARPKPKKSCAVTLSQAPQTLTPTPEQSALAQKHDLDLPLEVQRCLDHYQARGTRFADWQAVLSNWLRNAAVFKGERQRQAAQHSAAPSREAVRAGAARAIGLGAWLAEIPATNVIEGEVSDERA
ncbi:YdaU family protein [Neisseriaceae bacterium JH1-16]|nr:YdaU family protein [Neisseriaceae bacterium JH1-16]